MDPTEFGQRRRKARAPCGVRSTMFAETQSPQFAGRVLCGLAP